MKNILITGANGQLGSEFRHISKRNSKFNFFFTDINELDITNLNDIEEYLDKKQPEVKCSYKD